MFIGIKFVIWMNKKEVAQKWYTHGDLQWSCCWFAFNICQKLFVSVKCLERAAALVQGWPVYLEYVLFSYDCKIVKFCVSMDPIVHISIQKFPLHVDLWSDTHNIDPPCMYTTYKNTAPKTIYCSYRIHSLMLFLGFFMFR